MAAGVGSGYAEWRVVRWRGTSHRRRECRSAACARAVPHDRFKHICSRDLLNEFLRYDERVTHYVLIREFL